jgi:cell division protein ZapB
MEANKPVKIAAAALMIAVLLVAFKSCSSGRLEEQAVVVDGGEALSEESLAGLGIEGDTEKDVVATLIGEVRGLKSDIEILRQDNRGLRTDNDDLKKMEKNISRRLEGKISQAQTDVRQETQDKYNAMLRRLQEAESSLKRGQSLSVTQGTGELSTAPDESETVWIQPLGRSADEGSAGQTNQSLFGQARSELSRKIGTGNLPGVRQRNDLEEPTMKPVYTIAKNSTLVNSTAMTALVGRVPIGSQVTDPYSFKVIIGRDNLIANGIELPEVAYSIASGKAIGDWTLGCVRGDVYSMTFVFQDGTIRTVPKATNVYDGGGKSQEIKIGELSDAFGNPCVVGKRITNAYTYLAQRIGVTAVAAAAEAAAASQTTVLTSVGGGGIATEQIVDGNSADYILGKTISDGTMEVAKWLDERQAQQFDAIYVEPGADVSLHITEQIEIDYDELGRKTNHLGMRTGGYRGLD